MRPCLILTRPQTDAVRFAAQACADGWQGDVLIAPLLRIVLMPPPRARLDGAGTLVFTSQHGVAAVAAATPRRDWPVWAVGPRTAEAAREAGFTDLHQSGGDAVALLKDLRQTLPRPPVLHLRGVHAAADIATTLRATGQKAEALVVYRQEALDLTLAARNRLTQGGDIVLPVFSPRSAQLLADALGPQAGRKARLHVIAISDAAARPFRQFSDIALHIADHPDACAMRTVLTATQPLLEPWQKPR